MSDNGMPLVPMFVIEFRSKNHVSKGAPKAFYENKENVFLCYGHEIMDDFVAKRRNTWMRDLMMIERTVRNPQTCELETPSDIMQELAWDERISLKRKFRKLECECVLMKVDGRFVVPLVGPYAPIVKEVL